MPHIRITRGVAAPFKPNTPQAAQAEAIAVVQDRLDALAASWGYDNIHTLRMCVNSSHPRFKAEGDAGQAFYDATWGAVDAHRDASSVEELLSYLPPAPPRPIVS